MTDLHVVAGAVFDSAGRVLIAQRPAGKALAGRWEFPGGKLHTDEEPYAGLVRELREELGIEVHAAGRLIRGGAGVLLLLLGLLQWQGISPGSNAVYAVARPFVHAQARLRRQRPALAFGLFGFGYILAGFG